MRTVLAAFLFLVSFLPAHAEEPSAAMASGRELSKLFIERKVEPVWARMAPVMQGALGSRANLEAFREQVGAQLGDEVQVLEEKTSKVQGMDVYLRVSKWAKGPDRIAMQWAFDAGGKVVGFYVKPEAAMRAPQ